MKNKTRSRLFTTILLLGGGLAALSGLTSCNNFLKASEVKKEIEDAIAYANAQSCKLYLKSDVAMGSFLSGNEVTCKVGYTTDLQFTLNKDDWYFVSLEAVSTTDETQSREDYVEFGINEKKSDLARGIYVITIKLLKAADDILITPKCLELPYIKDFSPSETRVQYANTPIVITFNMPVEDEIVSQADSIFNYDNIKLSATNIDYSYYNDSFNGDMKDYFYHPEFNSQKTVLTLVPRAELLKEFIENLQQTFLEINVSFSNITIAQDDLSFTLKQGTVSDFVIRYNSETEEVAPVKTDFFITKEVITLADAAFVDDENKYPETTSTSFTKKSHKKNLLAPSTLYIYGKYYDQDSGVAAIEVSEYLESSTSTLPSTREKIITSYSIKEENNFISFYEDGTGYTSFVIKYVIQENLKPSPVPGIVSLTVSVKDLCGNTSEAIKVAVLNLEKWNISYYTAWIKENQQNSSVNIGYPEDSNDHYLNTSATYFDVCNAPFSKASLASGNYDFSKYNSDIKTIRIKDEYKPSFFSFIREIKPNEITQDKNKDYIIYCNEVDYICEYIDRYGNKRTEPFTPYNSETMERTVTLDVDKVAGMSFYVIPMYKGSPMGRIKFTFPDAPLLSSITQKYISVAPAETQNNSAYETQLRLALCKYPDNSYKIVFISGGSVTKNNIPDDCSCYFLYTRLNGYSQTFPEDKYIFNTTSQKYVKDSSYNTASLGTELNGVFQPTKEWFDRGLMSELLGPYSKTQLADTTPDVPETTFSKSLGNDGYINVTLQWNSDLWSNYDTLVCKLDETLVTLRSFDTFNKDGKVCYTIPVVSTKFFTVSSSSVIDKSIDYTCRGAKNNITSTKENKTVSLSDTEKSELDNIKPSNLYFNNTVCVQRKEYCEFLFYDYGSGPQTGKIWVNDKSTPYYMSLKQDKVNCYGSQIPAQNFVWGNNTIKYELKDKQGNTTEGSLLFYLPNNSELTHKFIKTDAENTITANGSTFSAKTYETYTNNVNNGSGFLYVYGYNGSGWTTEPIATYNESNKINNTEISVSVSGYSFINVIYTSKSRFDSTIYYTNTFDATGSNNYVIPNGTKNDSVVICSNNQKVLVRVYKVSRIGPDKDLCQNWNEDKWELFGALESEEIFTVTSKTPTVYTNDRLKNYLEGYYYCVIAHFANGRCVASPVMHK